MRSWQNLLEFKIRAEAGYNGVRAKIDKRMNKKDFKQLTKMHISISQAFVEDFEKLKGDSCTQEEKNVLESSTLCCSFMMLEAVGRSFSQFNSLKEALEDFQFLETQVKNEKEFILSKLQEFANENKMRIDFSNQENLLNIEKSILEKL